MGSRFSVALPSKSTSSTSVLSGPISSANPLQIPVPPISIAINRADRNLLSPSSTSRNHKFSNINTVLVREKSPTNHLFSNKSNIMSNPHQSIDNNNDSKNNDNPHSSHSQTTDNINKSPQEVATDTSAVASAAPINDNKTGDTTAPENINHNSNQKQNINTKDEKHTNQIEMANKKDSTTLVTSSKSPNPSSLNRTNTILPGDRVMKNNTQSSQSLNPHARDGDRSFSSSGGQTTFPSGVGGKLVEYSGTSNSVITSEYSIWSFLPKNLFFQFRNVANLYFLFIGILQIIPVFSTTNGIPTQYEPLAFIVAVSAIRAAMEDYSKHVTDRKRNNHPYLALRPDGFKPVASGDLRVGDIVKIEENDMIPADMIFLGSSQKKGQCFIDKANLNGETRLEVMNALNATKSFCQSDQTVQSLHVRLTYEPPNKHFDTFRGYIYAYINENDHKESSVDGKSLVMRETVLRNTPYIYGLLVYTGNDTKIQKSNLEGEKPRKKVSLIFRQVQTLLTYMLTVQVSLCLLGGLLAGLYNNALSDHWYLELYASGAYSSPVTGIFGFFYLVYFIGLNGTYFFDR